MPRAGSKLNKKAESITSITARAGPLRPALFILIRKPSAYPFDEVSLFTIKWSHSLSFPLMNSMIASCSSIFLGMDPAVVLQESSVAPCIGPERYGYDRDAGFFREFDPDRIERFRIEDRGAGRLRKDDDRTPCLKPLRSPLQNGFEILPWVGAAYRNGIS
jgi:hypothetical protein